jgi:hypothetical protein
MGRGVKTEMLVGHLPFNTSFFCCVDFGDLRCVIEQKAFDVVEEEVLSLGIGEIQAVVINDLCLFLQPGAPTWLANLGSNSLSESVGKRRESESGALLAAVCAFDCVSHHSLLEILYFPLCCANGGNINIILWLE